MEDCRYDTIIVGAGLIGLSVAYNLKLKRPDSRILLIEKEDKVALHQSGNNSGVIHSGIYYKPGSLKAQNCIKGYNTLLQFAEEHQIPHEICGKIIVATSNAELKVLNNIYDRGLANGLSGISRLSSAAIKEYEPHCAGIEGIHVPQTGIIDYPKMAKVLLHLFVNKYNGEVRFNEQVTNVVSKDGAVYVDTTTKSYGTNKLVTCAGLFSDRVASLTESNNDLRIIPFRGEYYKLKESKKDLVKNLIYPVPDPNFPFLGVHFTRMINGQIEAGPNAVLALKREGYKFSDINLKDLSDTLTWPGFWKVVGKYGGIGMGEIYRSLSKAAFTRALQKLIPEITASDLVPGGAGVRAQACDRQGNLIDDFNYLEYPNIIHVRNAPSPAATACLSIGELITQKIISR